MVDKTVNSNVGVNINPKGMTAAARQVEERVEKIAQAINAAGTAANAQLKAMAIGLKQVQTLQSVQARQTLGNVGQLETLGKQARAVAEYRAGISKTSDALGVLRGRLRQINVENGKLVQAGQRVPRGSLLKAENLEKTADAYGKIGNQVNSLRGRIAVMGEDSRKAFAPMLANIDALDAKNKKLFGRNNQTSFGPQLGQMQRAAASLKEQVVLTEKADLAHKKKLTTLRQEGQQLLANNRLQREAALAAQVRSANTRFRNLELTGGKLYQREIDQTKRLTRATNLATTTKRQLAAEMAKPNPGVARLDTLINRYRVLQREIGQTIAIQNRQQVSNRGGFFAGLKTAPGNLLSEEGGGAFGAGQLIGRVGAYAVAAGAIYGLISSIQQGISFAIEFEDALAQLKAISGSTTTEMERLSAGILKVSTNSANSVLELTKSATIIAQAGYAGAEIETLLQNVVNLSAASGSSTDESVDILTSALGSFQLAASEATNVTDALVSALNDSKLSVNQVQLGLQYVGATARLNNITFNELVATLGAMADAGIRSGSTMSTGLRQMLVDFLDPSKKLITQLEKVGLTTADIDVKVLGLTEVLTRLRDSGFQAYGSLETRAAAAYAVLSSNIDQIGKLEQATLKQNVAQEAASERIQSVSARWQRMLNVLSSLGAEIGENFSPAMSFLITLLEGAAVAILGLVKVLTFPLRIFGLLSDEVEQTSVTLQEATQAFEDAGFSAEEAALRASQMGEGLEDVTTALKDTKAEIESLETEQASLKTETEKLIVRQQDLAGKNGDLTDTTAEVRNQINLLANRFPGLRAEFKKTEGGIQGLINAMIALDRKAQETLRNLAQTRLAQANMERRSSLRELGGIQSNLRGIPSTIKPRAGTRGGRLSSRGGISEEYSADYNAVMRELKKNTTSGYENALEIFNRNPRLQRAFPETYGQVGSAMSRYYAARSEGDTATQTIRTADFILSEEGQRITVNMQADTANATRASSQGSSNGRTSAQIRTDLQARLEDLAEMEERYADNDAALGLIGQAVSSTRAALAQLTPDSGSGGSDRRGGSTRSQLQRAAQRRERELARIDARIKKEEVDYKKELYENSLRIFENAPDLEDVYDALEDVDENMSAWLNSEAELAIEQIEKLNPTDAQRTQMLETAARKSEELRKEQIDKIAGILARVLKDFIDSSTNAIEAQYKEAMRFTERNLAIAQGRLNGLSNPIYDNNTPEYFKKVKQREVDVAADRNQIAQIGANDTKIQQYLDLLEQVREQREDIERRITRLGKMTQEAEESGDDGLIVVTGARLSEAKTELRGIDEELQRIEATTQDLIVTNDALKAGYEVLNEVPTTFREGIRAALEAVKYDINAADNLGQELIKNLDQPLKAVHESFKGFFYDVISGTKSLGDAFKDMAGRIIDAILQMVAVALANQFFSLIAGVLGGPTGGGFGGGANSGSGGVLGNFLSGFGNGWTGGHVGSKVKAKPMYTGGSISSGIGTRDSTLVHAAKDEYIIRRPAAMSLGKGFLDAINARGANALRDVGAGNVIPMPTAPPVETNVYIVAPEEKPQLGPNDVIAIFSQDVLKGGSTKQLIKKVASGG